MDTLSLCKLLYYTKNNYVYLCRMVSKAQCEMEKILRYKIL